MELPSKDDYVEAYSTLFEKFEQDRNLPPGRGRPYEYEERILIVFFTMMMRGSKSIKLARNNAQIAEWAKNNHELF